MNVKAYKGARFPRVLQNVLVLVVAAIIFGGGAVAPYAYETQVRDEPTAPASIIRFRDSAGNFHLRPFIYRRQLIGRLNFGYEEVAGERYPITVFERGSSYIFGGILPGSVHLFGTSEETVRLTLLGTDALGRDRFSRLVIAMRFSLIVCLAGTLLASVIGIVFGMFSGYAGRFGDAITTGIADSVLALPTLIIILAVRAAFPLELPAFRAAMLLILIFAFTGWAEMARLARGLVKATREQEYVKAAKASGTSEAAILFRHIFPNISSALITQSTIMLPYFLLSEVALSYLGVGLQEPVPSLGNMLASAGDLGHLQRHPVLLLSPAIVIFIFVFLIRLITRYVVSTEQKFTVS